MLIRICVVTSTRADYGILSPLLKRLQNDPAFDLTIAATGTHLLASFGHTIKEIRQDGFEPTEISIMDEPPKDGVAVSDVMANTLRAFARFFAERSFNLLLILGDRYEMAAVCAAAVNVRLPIAHLHGGETSQGAIDECYRHAITKMSVLHFTSCDVYRRRVLQMGEQPDHVYNVGALCVENIRGLREIPLEKLARELALPLSRMPYAVVTFHPVTQEEGSALPQLRELMSAMDVRRDLYFLITKSNADEGGCDINAEWEAFVATRGNCRLIASLGMTRFLTALKHSRMMLGNSSSGIIEAPICGVPTVNIGDRQKGRLRTDSILDCAPEKTAIVAAMAQAEESSFRQKIANQVCPYGDGSTSVQIVAVLKKQMNAPITPEKVFCDLPEGV